MKASDIKRIVKEEIKIQRKRLLAEGIPPQQPQAQAAPVPVPQAQSQPEPSQQTKPAPKGLNPNKAKGIITGAVKTLVNSGALNGVDISSVEKITADLLSHLQKTAPTYLSTTEPEVPGEDEIQDGGLDDDHMYDTQNDELSDQSQYDPSLEKTSSDAEEKNEEEPTGDVPEEPLFEAKDFKVLLK